MWPQARPELEVFKSIYRESCCSDLPGAQMGVLVARKPQASQPARPGLHGAELSWGRVDPWPHTHRSVPQTPRTPCSLFPALFS